MRYESNCGLEPLKNLFRRQRLMERGDVGQYDYRAILFASTGVLRGVDGGGRARALERYKLNRMFTHVVGSSTGAAMTLFFLAEQIHKHLNMYWVEAASKDFVDFWRFPNTERPIEDTNFLCKEFRRKLNHGAVIAAPAEFYVGVTCAITGKGLFLNAKKVKPDVVTAIEASISIPGLCGGPVFVDGHPYYDGAGAMGMPTREIIEQFGPTDLLIFANCSNENKTSILGQIVTGLLLMQQPLPVQKAFLTRNKRFAEGIRYLREEAQCRWAIVWSDDNIGQYERDPQKLEATANRADEHFSCLLDQAKAEVNQEKALSLAAQ